MAKRMVDVAVASLLLVLGLPVVLVIAPAIKALAQGGSVLFRQTRCGLNGRFVHALPGTRTMVGRGGLPPRGLQLREMNGRVFKLQADPRVTWPSAASSAPFQPGRAAASSGTCCVATWSPLARAR